MDDLKKDQHNNSPGMDRLKQPIKIKKHQKMVLLDFLEKNFEYHRGAFKLLPGSEGEDKNMLWEQITPRLNGLGPKKTSIMWRKTCADLRMQIKKKIIEDKELTDEDKRMAKFYGLKSLEKGSRLVNERVTAAQKSKMIDLIRDNFWYNQNTLKLESKTPNSIDWDEIGEELNIVGGCIKNTIAWRKCWSDIKCDVGKKFSHGAVPKMLTEDEYKIATLYGWLNGEQVMTNNTENFDPAASPVQYVVDPTVIIKSEGNSELETQDELIIPHESEDFVIERLDEEEHEADNVDDTLENTVEAMDDLPAEDETTRTIFVMQAATQTDSAPEPMKKTTNDNRDALLQQILEAQLRTNTLLEQLLEKNVDNNTIQNGILDELKSNSFMMVNRGFPK